MDTETMSDASLVLSSLAGDRDAFGRIVARYQSPICALAYSACGNVSRSEDIAQEVFITAWRKLASLSDPARFKAWLYGIARNLIRNALRQHNRNPVANANLLEDTAETADVSGEPDEEAISKEEETILWHVLSGLPQVYREPLVLFYRQNGSVPQVAEVLEISEEAVRQRLSRGRVLLNDRVAKVVQNGLRRSGPTDAFAVGVIASVSALAAAATAKGAVVGMAATKSATGQATGLAALLKGIGIFAGIIALPATLGTFFGYKLGQDATGLPQQRKSVSRFWRVFGTGLALFLFLPLLLTFGVTGFLHDEARAHFLSAMTWWLGLAYPLVLVALMFWAWQRRRQQSFGTPGSPAQMNQSESHPQAGLPIPAGKPRNPVRRFVLFMTVAAAGLLVFCYTDTNHNVGHLTSSGLRDLINQSSPGMLKLSLMEGHDHSLFREYPTMYQYLWVEVSKDGKVAKYTANADDATLAFLAQKGISYPTYLAGRDFEVLGTPGRMLPVLAAFILAIGGIFLIMRGRKTNSGVN